MVGYRIVDVGAHTDCGEPRAQSVPFPGADDVKMCNIVLAAGGRNRDSRICKFLRVPARNLASPFVPAINKRKLLKQASCLHFIEPAVAAAGYRIAILSTPPVLPQLAHTLRERVVVRHHGAPIAKCSQIFRGIKAETSEPS